MREIEKNKTSLQTKKEQNNKIPIPSFLKFKEGKQINELPFPFFERANNETIL